MNPDFDYEPGTAKVYHRRFARKTYFGKAFFLEFETKH